MNLEELIEKKASELRPEVFMVDARGPDDDKFVPGIDMSKLQTFLRSALKEIAEATVEETRVSLKTLQGANLCGHCNDAKWVIAIQQQAAAKFLGK